MTDRHIIVEPNSASFPAADFTAAAAAAAAYRLDGQGELPMGTAANCEKPA